MTSAISAVASGVLDDLYHSAPMVLDRYPARADFLPGCVTKGLAMKSMVLSLLCATLAFLLYAIGERKLVQAAPAVHAPVVLAQERPVAENAPAPRPERL